MSRWKAAAIHLSINVLIALLAAALIFGVWYPWPYSQAAGAGTLIVLLLGVDLVLGPLLTLIVFKPGKKGLAFDLGVIALLQVCAFAYGLSVVTRARPAFIVGEIDRFVLVAANELDGADLAKATRPEFRSAPWTGPRLVGAQIPTDSAARNDLTFSGPSGKDIEMFPQYYANYETVAPQLLAHAKSLVALRKDHAESAAVIDAWLHAHTGDGANVVWLPLKARAQGLTMLLDRNSGKILDALPIDPW